MMPEKVTKTDEPIVERTVLDADPKPVKRRGRPPGSKNVGRGANVSTIKDGLTGYVAMIGTTLCMFPRTASDGQIVLQGAEPLVDSLCELAKNDKRVRRVLTIMCTGGAWTGVVIASANIAVPIAANHGFLPGFLAPMFAAEVEESNNGDSAEETQVFTMRGKDVG